MEKSAGVSLFPLQELMIICRGCGGERLIPEEELAQILSVEDFDRFMKTSAGRYGCRCGHGMVDVRMLPNAAAQADMKKPAS